MTSVPAPYVGDRVGDLPEDKDVIPGTTAELSLNGSSFVPENDHDLVMESWREESSFVAESFGFRVHCRRCRMTTMRHWAGVNQPDAYDGGAHALRLVLRFGACCADVPKVVEIEDVQGS